MKKCVFYIFLNLVLFSVSSNTLAENYGFKIGIYPPYQQGQYKIFIKELRKYFIGSDYFSIGIRRPSSSNYVNFKVSLSDFSIIEINGYNLQDLNVDQYPSVSTLRINRSTFDDAFEKALTFGDQLYPQRLEVMMVFSFFITESLRFTNIADISDSVLNRDQERQWMDYKTLFENWSDITGYYLPELVGGLNNRVSVQFPNTGADTNPDVIYNDYRNGKFVPVYPTMLETWRNFNPDQDSKCKEHTFYNCLVGSALQVDFDLLPSVGL